MSRRIDIDATEIGPPLDEVIRHLEAGSADELVIRRDGREVARLSPIRAGAPVGAETRQYAWDAARDRRDRENKGSMGKFLTNLFGLALVGALLAFVLAPAYAFFALRSAALTGDVPALAELVDYGAVRASLRPQLSDDPRAAEPEPSWIENPIEAIRRRLGQAAEAAVASPEVDGYLTPQALAGLTYGEGRYASERSRAGAPGIEREASSQPWPEVVHWSPGRARFRIADEGGSRTVFTFTRQGVFTWRLSHVGLPDGGTPAPPADTDAVPQAG